MLNKKNRLSIESAYGIEMLHNHCIDLNNRQIWIHGTPINLTSADEAGFEPGVEYMMATKVIKNLHLLLMQSEKEPVTIHLHTCGGMWEEGIAIYDTIKSMPFNVTIISYTHARSMSSIILQAADRRIMMPNSYFLFHRGYFSVAGDHKTAQTVAKWYDKIDSVMLDIYLERIKNSPKFSGKTDAFIKKTLISAMDKYGDVYLKPKEAIHWGFADAIFTSWDDTRNI